MVKEYPSWENQKEFVSRSKYRDLLENSEIVIEGMALYRINEYDKEQNEYVVEYKSFYKFRNSEGNTFYSPRHYFNHPKYRKWENKTLKVKDPENLENNVLNLKEIKPLTGNKNIIKPSSIEGFKNIVRSIFP